MKNKLERLWRALLHNWVLKLASLFLAFVVWFIVIQVGDPQDTRPYSNIQVRLVNTELLENQNKVYEILDRTDFVRVMVTAPTSVFQTLRAGDIIAEADVSKLTDINTIAITYSTLNSNLDIVSFEGDHDVVRLNVEDKTSKWVRITSQTVGSVAEGYIIGGMTTDQTLINIAGPESEVSLVTGAYAELNVEGATNNISANVDIYLRDAEGNRLEFSRVEKSAEHLHMTAEILATKEVRIEAKAMGEPAEGYLLVGDASLSEEKVTIAGTPANLANITRIVIPPEKLDVTGMTEDKTFAVNLRDCLPGNIRLASTDSVNWVNVNVQIRPTRERTLEIPAQNISLQNLPDDFEVKLFREEGEQPEAVSLKVYGLRDKVNALRAGNIVGTADIGEWMKKQEIRELTPGVYEIPTYFELSEVEILESGTIRVEITEKDL